MKKLDKEFIPYKEAIALKKLGFNERCYGNYADDKDHTLFTNGNSPGKTNAPLYQQAFRWFREKHKLFGYVFDTNKKSFYWGINTLFIQATLEDTSEGPFYKKYEEAQLACLKKLIEIIKNE